MNIQSADTSHIPDIMRIIEQAREYMKQSGIDQWQNGVPNEDTIRNDIANNESYVIIEDDKVIATFMSSFRIDHDYDEIFEGSWSSDEPYAVIHRVAIDNSCKGKGISGRIIDYVVDKCNNHSPKINIVRGDTHPDNISMQRTFRKNGYTYRGIVFLSKENARHFAYEKIICPQD